MENGLLWFDDRKKISTEQKIENAVLFFKEKYGKKPDCCYINTAESGLDAPDRLAGLRIETSQYVLPNHFLLEREN